MVHVKIERLMNGVSPDQMSKYAIFGNNCWKFREISEYMNKSNETTVQDKSADAVLGVGGG